MAAVPVTYPAPGSGMSYLHESFHPFPRLPSEIQIRIWKLAMPEPRKMYVKVNYIPWKKCAPPALLRVNTQSREVAQEVFRLCILPSCGPQKAIYMGPHDVVYFLKWFNRNVRVHSARPKNASIFAPYKMQFAGKTFKFSTKTLRIDYLAQLSMYAADNYEGLRKNTLDLFHVYYHEDIPLKLWVRFTRTPEMEENRTWDRSGGRLVRTR
jgi:hypothetical protein